MSETVVTNPQPANAAVENISLEKRIVFLEAEVQRFKKLLEIGQTFQSEMELDNLLILIVDRTSDSIGADRCSVFIYNPEKGILWTRVAQKEKQIVVPRGHGIVGWVLDNKEPLLIADAYQDPRFDSSVDLKTGYRTQSIAALPLLDRRGKPLGVFEAVNKTDGTAFDARDLDFLRNVAVQIAAAIENAMLYTQLLETFESFLDVMAFSIDAKHPVARGHSRRVAMYSKGIAMEMELSQESVDKVYWAALLHDYGKISVPDAILQKAGKLTDDEFEQIKRHALMTYRILSRIHFAAFLRDIPLIASEHHERWDGRGYPFGKKDEQIPLGARIIATADVFDALTSFREYHSPMTFAEARDEIIKGRGVMFDPRVVDAFVQYYDKELDPYKLRQALWKSMGK